MIMHKADDYAHTRNNIEYKCQEEKRWIGLTSTGDNV